MGLSERLRQGLVVGLLPSPLLLRDPCPSCPVPWSSPPQVAKAVHALHQAGLLHGELRPENILLLVASSNSNPGRGYDGDRSQGSSNHHSGRLMPSGDTYPTRATFGNLSWPHILRGSPRPSPPSSVVRGSPASSIMRSSGGRGSGHMNGLEVGP